MPEGAKGLSKLPKMLRIFFKHNRRLTGKIRRCALRSMIGYFEIVTRSKLMPGVIAAIQTFGDRINFYPHFHFLVTEGGVNKIGRTASSPCATRGSRSTAASGPRSGKTPSGWGGT
jgi:hypothetical protein